LAGLLTAKPPAAPEVAATSRARSRRAKPTRSAGRRAKKK